MFKKMLNTIFGSRNDRLLNEFQIVLNSSLEDTQKKLDKALKRNLEKQIQKNESKAPEEKLQEAKENTVE